MGPRDISTHIRPSVYKQLKLIMYITTTYSLVFFHLFLLATSLSNLTHYLLSKSKNYITYFTFYFEKNTLLTFGKRISSITKQLQSVLT